MALIVRGFLDPVAKELPLEYAVELNRSSSSRWKGASAELTKTIEGVTAAFNRDAVVARTHGEPEWLRERRLAAWRVYEETPLPTAQLEEWRYTDVSQLALDQVHLAEPDAADASGARAELEGKAAAGRVVQVNASVVETWLDESLKAKGVLLLDLATAAREHPELVREHLATQAVPAEAGKFAALNAALWTAGVFLYVPRGVRIEEPIRVARWIDEAGIASSRAR